MIRLALFSLLLITQPASTLPTSDPLVFIQRMERSFNLRGRALEEIDVGSNAKPPHGVAFAWSQAVRLSALAAAARADPANLPTARAVALELDAYRQTRGGVEGYQVLPGPGPSERYYDDNAWLAIAFVELYQLTHDPADLVRARSAWGFVASGESPELGGGVWWREQHDSKNTCSNAPAIVAALILNDVAPDPHLVDTARRLFAWTNAHFQDTDELYFDSLKVEENKPQPKLDKTKWTYNAALMLRAHILLARIDHETADGPLLTRARSIARASLRRWFKPREPGERVEMIADDGPFAQHLVEALLEFASVTHDPILAARVRAAVVGETAQISPDGWFGKRWDKPVSGDTFRLIDQAAVARAWLLVSSPAPVTTRTATTRP